MEFVILAKMFTPYILLFFMVATPVSVRGIYDMYDRWKENQLTVKYVITFVIQYVIATILSYYVYCEVIILSP